MTLRQIAGELGTTTAKAQKIVTRFAYLGFTPRRSASGTTTYPATALDLLKGMRGQPHRLPPEPGQDWLSSYLGGRSDE